MGGNDGGFGLDDDDGIMGKCNIHANNRKFRTHNRSCDRPMRILRVLSEGEYSELLFYMPFSRRRHG